MRKRILLAGALAGVLGSVAVAQVPAPAAANHYRNLNVAVYARAQEVDKMKDAQWLQQSWDVISRSVKVSKIYLESHRDRLLVAGETLEKAKAFFAARGVQTFGGITWTRNEGNRFETFCYANPVDPAPAEGESDVRPRRLPGTSMTSSSTIFSSPVARPKRRSSPRAIGPGRSTASTSCGRWRAT